MTWLESHHAFPCVDRDTPPLNTSTDLPRARALASRLLRGLLVSALAFTVFVVAMTLAFGFANRDRWFTTPVSIVVYGTERCSHTQALRDDLDAQAIPYVFADVDKPLLFQEMQVRLGVYRGEFTAPTIRLPVVYQAKVARERPPFMDVADRYRTALAQR